MAKITLNVNLFPCARNLPTDSYTDLTDNLPLATKLAKAATQIFWIRGGSARFSGYIYEGKEGLSIQIWHRNRLHRTVRFPGVGYSGVLYVDIKGNRVQEAIGCDVLGDLYRTETLVLEEYREVSFIGSHTVPEAKGSFCRRGSKQATRQSREAIVKRLMNYLETGC